MSDAPTPAPAFIRWRSFDARVLIGMAAGVLLGLVARALPGGEADWLAQALHTVGQSSVQLLKALVPRRRERAMLRFRAMRSLQKFASVHANVHNHFASERHLVYRKTYKARRSAAFAAWQILAASSSPL